VITESGIAELRETIRTELAEAVAYVDAAPLPIAETALANVIS